MYLPEFPASASLSPAEQAHLHDLARQAAEALRQEAQDDFWRGANAVLERSLDQTGRAARRLAARLRRRQPPMR